MSPWLFNVYVDMVKDLCGVKQGEEVKGLMKVLYGFSILKEWRRGCLKGIQGGMYRKSTNGLIVKKLY